MSLEAPKFVPEDILIFIFLRLQIKSLGVCRCVCKTWHHTIGTSSFVKTHLTLQKTSSEANNCILFQLDRLCTLLTTSQSIFDGTLTHSKFYNTFRILNRYNDSSFVGGPRIHGICNGLLCLSAYHYKIGDPIYLWNPTCRKIKKLPKIDKCIKDDIGFTCKACVTFGYYDDDCTVIVIAPIGNAYIVCLYTLTTNSWTFVRTNSWNTIQTQVHYRIYKNSLDEYCRVKETKFVDGTVYMIESDHVTCFDLSSETIRVIPFPIEISRYIGYKFIDERYRQRNIISLPREFSDNNGFTSEAYGETIAIFGYGDLMSPYMTMWILRDKSSFTPVWVVKKDELVSSNYHPLGFLKNGQYLISLTGCRSHLFSCNLSNPKLSEPLSVCGSPFIVKGRIHSRYVESLLLLDEDNLDPIDLYSINGDRVCPES